MAQIWPISGPRAFRTGPSGYLSDANLKDVNDERQSQFRPSKSIVHIQNRKCEKHWIS